jgi:hypothetical protein
VNRPGKFVGEDDGMVDVVDVARSSVHFSVDRDPDLALRNIENSPTTIRRMLLTRSHQNMAKYVCGVDEHCAAHAWVGPGLA